jgi:hypothetical protein
MRQTIRSALADAEDATEPVRSSGDLASRRSRVDAARPATCPTVAARDQRVMVTVPA